MVYNVYTEPQTVKSWTIALNLVNHKHQEIIISQKEKKKNNTILEVS